MSEDPANTNKAKTEIERQAKDKIEEGTDAIELLEAIDFGSFKRQYDGYEDSHKSTPFKPMLRAYYLKELEGYTDTDLHRRLDSNPDEAAALGFEDGIPARTTFCRTWRDRFDDDLNLYAEDTAGEIRSIAAEYGAPIGSSIEDVKSGADGEPEPSERTMDRLLRRKGKQVLDELEATVFPSINLPRPDEAVYDEEELMVLESIAALNHDAANGSGKSMGEKKNPEPDLDDPYYEDGPSGETLLNSIKELTVIQIAVMMNLVLRKTYTRAKPRLKDLEHDNGKRFGVRAKVALDITYVAYDGDLYGMIWIQGSPDSKDYEWCHKFATIVIVGDNTHYTVGVYPLGSTEFADTHAYAGTEKSYYVGDVARELLSIADEFVNIQMGYADREFHAADVISALEERGLNYVIPAVENDRIRRICNDFNSLSEGNFEENDVPLYVDQDFPIHGRVKHGPSNSKVYTNVVVLPPESGRESPQPFLTNLDVNDEIALDRRWTKKQIEQYSERGAIENSYSSIKEAAAWTTSKEFEIRWLHFAFGCVIYNLWLLVDFLTQERLGVIETRKKPRISLSLFTTWLDKVLITLI